MRILLSDIIQQARQENSHEAAKHNGRQHLCEHITLILMKYLRVTSRERYRAFAHTPSHDWHDCEKKCVACSHPQRRADQRSNYRRHHRSGGKRNEYFQKSLDQHSAIHTEDTADNNRGDKQVEKVSVLKKRRHWLQQRSRQQMVKGQT